MFLGDTLMQRLLQSKRLGLCMASAFGLFGFCLAGRRIAIENTFPDATPSQFQIANLDSLLCVVGFGLLGLLIGLGLTAIQEALRSLDRAHELSLRQAEQWERLHHRLEAFDPSSWNGPTLGSPAPTRHEGVDAIVRAIQGNDWKEADLLLKTLTLEEPDNPEIDRLRLHVESGRSESVEALLERIRVSREVNDSDRVLELYQELSPILEIPARKMLDDELARWFMAQIQRRLRSGIIQADVVNLSAKVSELFGGTTEGASLRAGLPTLRRTVGLCPRCAGPYVGVAQACPTCLGAAS